MVWARHLRIRPRRIHDHAKGHLPRPTSRGTGRDETDESAAEVRVSRAYEAAVETGTGEPRERRRGGWRRRRIFGNRETATGVDVGANPTNSTNRTFAGDVRAPAEGSRAVRAGDTGRFRRESLGDVRRRGAIGGGGVVAVRLRCIVDGSAAAAKSRAVAAASAPATPFVAHHGGSTVFHAIRALAARASLAAAAAAEAGRSCGV